MDLHERQITLVETEPSLSKILIDAVREMGFRLFSVHPEFAMTNLESLGGVVLVDVPNDHEIFYDLLRAIRLGTPASVIVLGDVTNPEIRAQILDSVNDYIPKPVHAHELLARIRLQLRLQVLANNSRSSGNPNDRAGMMAHRLIVIADGLRALRINSISDQIHEIENIAAELSERQSRSLATQDDLRSSTIQALPVLAKIFDVAGSKVGAEMLVAGAVAGLVSLGGWPAVTAYSLSVAAWHGKEAFIEAVKALGGKKEG